MDRRRLGRTDIEVSRLGLGTVKFGRNTGVKYPRAFELPSDREILELLELAVAGGINLLDTAPAYGTSEERLAPFLRQHRDDVVLCTKAGEVYGPSGSHFDFSPAALTTSAENSLRRLGVEVVDLLLLHSDGRDVARLVDDGAADTLLELKRRGLVRAVGISAKTVAGIEAGAAVLDVVMAPLSAAEQSLASALAQAHADGSGVLAIKTMASGHAAVASTPTESLRGVLNERFVDCAVLGTISPAHLRDAMALLPSD